MLDLSCTASSRRALCDNNSPRYERFSRPRPSVVHASNDQIKRMAQEVSNVRSQNSDGDDSAVLRCEKGDVRTATDGTQNVHLNSVPTRCWWPVEWTLLEPQGRGRTGNRTRTFGHCMQLPQPLRHTCDATCQHPRTHPPCFYKLENSNSECLSSNDWNQPSFKQLQKQV